MTKVWSYEEARVRGSHWPRMDCLCLGLSNNMKHIFYYYPLYTLHGVKYMDPQKWHREGLKHAPSDWYMFCLFWHCVGVKTGTLRCSSSSACPVCSAWLLVLLVLVLFDCSLLPARCLLFWTICMLVCYYACYVWLVAGYTWYAWYMVITWLIIFDARLVYSYWMLVIRLAHCWTWYKSCLYACLGSSESNNTILGV